MEPYDISQYLLEDTRRIEKKAGRFRKGDETIEIVCVLSECDKTRRMATANLDRITDPVLCEGHAAIQNAEADPAHSLLISEAFIIRSHPHLNIVLGSIIYDMEARRQTVQVVCSADDCDETITVQTQSLHATAGLCEWHLLEHRRKKSRDYVARWRERKEKNQ